MFEDSLYNLLNQLVQEQKSLWRIQNFYLPQAETEEEANLWQEIANDKVRHVEMLLKIVSEEI